MPRGAWEDRELLMWARKAHDIDLKRGTRARLVSLTSSPVLKFLTQHRILPSARRQHTTPPHQFANP
ncbi:hypothetical protein O3P69_015907 [Scylla paramamosain]|uniref:Uncharacterized protein n=1 Tax=Scylla paramamosain TaxID=85552 RepID=A0AAW0TBH4_SCYPA